MWTSAVSDWRWLRPDERYRDCLRRWVLESFRWIRRTLCGFRGHDFLLHPAAGRLCLECARCGHQTPGWQVGRPA